MIEDKVHSHETRLRAKESLRLNGRYSHSRDRKAPCLVLYVRAHLERAFETRPLEIRNPPRPAVHISPTSPHRFRCRGRLCGAFYVPHADSKSPGPQWQVLPSTRTRD